MAVQSRQDDANIVNPQGQTALHLLIASKEQEAQGDETYEQAVVDLLDKVPLAQRDSDGHTALDVAVSNEDFTAVEAISRHVKGILHSGDTDKVMELIREGWDAWPSKGVQEINDYPESSTYLAGYPIAPEVKPHERKCLTSYL